MAKTENISVRIDSELKKEVEQTLDDLGMNIADAITIYLKQIVLTESIPFAIKKPKFSDEMLEALAEAEQMERYPENYDTFESVEKFMEDLEDYEDEI